VVGLDLVNPMAAFTFEHPDGATGTKKGTYAIMGDGAVRWIPAGIDPKVFLAMATRAGGEKLPNLDEVAPRVDRPAKTAELKAVAPAPKATTTKPAETKVTEAKGAESKGVDTKVTDPKAGPDAKIEPPKSGTVPATKADEPKREPAPAPKEKAPDAAPPKN